MGKLARQLAGKYYPLNLDHLYQRKLLDTPEAPENTMELWKEMKSFNLAPTSNIFNSLLVRIIREPPTTGDRGVADIFQFVETNKLMGVEPTMESYALLTHMVEGAKRNGVPTTTIDGEEVGLGTILESLNKQKYECLRQLFHSFATKLESQSRLTLDEDFEYIVSWITETNPKDNWELETYLAFVRSIREDVPQWPIEDVFADAAFKHSPRDNRDTFLEMAAYVMDRLYLAKDWERLVNFFEKVVMQQLEAGQQEAKPVPQFMILSVLDTIATHFDSTSNKFTEVWNWLDSRKQEITKAELTYRAKWMLKRRDAEQFEQLISAKWSDDEVTFTKGTEGITVEMVEYGVTLYNTMQHYTKQLLWYRALASKGITENMAETMIGAIDFIIRQHDNPADASEIAESSTPSQGSELTPSEDAEDSENSEGAEETTNEVSTTTDERQVITITVDEQLYTLATQVRQQVLDAMKNKPSLRMLWLTYC
eukprot:TRINITY_DN61322_c0_g1_i1.p1 TRINITY_DN61322_c0_g1~~TRINITY_DN61322_c0_g1_i1.p1  ORF type:complete len:516 (+),score=36.86 TRINITY_DN61322_c0_g1_i1:104-1549(+)